MRVTQPREGEPIRLVHTKRGPRYRVVIDVGLTPDGRRRQVTKTFGGLGEARGFVIDTRASITRGAYVPPDTLTFDAICQRWLESRRDVREVTRRGYATVLKPVRGRVGHRKVQDLGRAEIEALVRWLATDGGQRGHGLSQRSIVFTLGAVRQVFAYAVSEGLILNNPAADVKAPRRQRSDARPVQVWEPSDLLAFRAVADLDDWAAGWRLTLSGLRRSEVLGMRWDSVDLSAGQVSVMAGRVALDGKATAIDDPKSAASWRTVPVESMHTGTMAVMRSLSVRQARERLAAGSAYTDTGLVLVDALGRPVRPEAYSDRFAVLCRDAGVPVVRLHSVRHTLATMLHRSGTAPADAAALLGHSVAVHLSTYVQSTVSGARSAGAALGEALAAVR